MSGGEVDHRGAKCHGRATIQVPLLYRNVQRFRDGFVFKVHRLLYTSTLGLRVIKKNRGQGRVTRRHTKHSRMGVVGTLLDARVRGLGTHDGCSVQKVGYL